MNIVDPTRIKINTLFFLNTFQDSIQMAGLLTSHPELNPEIYLSLYTITKKGNNNNNKTITYLSARNNSLGK